ncbi:DNA primase [Paenibacillus sp. y28]|uniref:DNA primase n=1 Tax=Paenibacillus sp. y28 TaxID=3129110 RepID=UPI0030170CCC
MSNGRVPQEVIDAVLKHHDIVDVVGKYVHLSKNGKYMKGLCPFHSEKTPSFTVTPEKQIFYCYGCHAGGTAIQFIMDIEGYTFPEAVRQLAEEAGVAYDFESAVVPRTEQDHDKAELLRAYDFSAKLYAHLLKNTAEARPAMDYLRSRGFTDAMIETFQIGYAPNRWDTLAQFLEKRDYRLPLMEQGGLISERSEQGGYYDRFRDRIMFPICDGKGNVIALAGRTMSADVQPKYMNSPETALFNKRQQLYNFHLARPQIRKSRQIVLFEGYADVIKAWAAGIHNGVATMGTALTEQHASILRTQADEVIVCYDGDDAGQNAAYKSLPILADTGCRVKIALLPDRMDPDEYITAKGADSFVRDIIEASLPVVRFKLQYMRRNFRLHDDDGRLQYIRASARLLAGIDSPAEREFYAKELADEFQFPMDTIKQEMHQHRQQQQKFKAGGDNNELSWNNVMHDGRGTKQAPALLPAYHNAERKLLAAMIYDPDVAETVQRKLGDGFHVEAHAALAAYLYAYYAQGHEAEPSRYIASIQDDQLEGIASSISMITETVTPQVIDDYIREIKKVPLSAKIERLKEDMVRADKSKDFIRAAQIAVEIEALKNELKSM